MVKILNGILDSGSGTIGNVTFRNVKGQSVASIKSNPHYANTPLQSAHRTKFIEASRWTKAAYAPLILPFWKHNPQGMNARNYFMKKILAALKSQDGLLSSSFNCVEGFQPFPPFQFFFNKDLENEFYFQMYEWPEGITETPWISFCCFIPDTFEVFVDPVFRVGGEEEYNQINFPSHLVLDDMLLGILLQDRSQTPYRYYSQGLHYVGS